jgi:hypothetical protein
MITCSSSTAALTLALSMVAGAAHAAVTTDGLPPAAETGGGFAPAPASATDAAGSFGAVGQLVLSLGATADEPFFFHKSGGAWQLQLAPAADYFLAPRLSVGGVLTYGHASGGAGTNSLGSDTFRLAARAGYVFAFNDRFGVWPLGGLAVGYASANHASDTNTWLTIYVPALFHPAPHFFVGLGPSAQVHLSGHAGTAWGIDSMLGGWF